MQITKPTKTSKNNDYFNVHGTHILYLWKIILLLSMCSYFQCSYLPSDLCLLPRKQARHLLYKKKLMFALWLIIKLFCTYTDMLSFLPIIFSRQQKNPSASFIYLLAPCHAFSLSVTMDLISWTRLNASKNK